MRRVHRSTLMPTMALSVACGGDAGRAGDVQVRIQDSVGVRIVEYASAPEVEPPFGFAKEPAYRHGADPGDYEFQEINVGRLFPDGSAAVADRGNGEVVVLSPDGATHRVLARNGQGPGDVAYPHSMFVRGRDSLFVGDPRLFRLTLFVGDSLARTASLPRTGLLGVAGIGSSGELLMANRVGSGSLRALEEEWLAGHMVRFDPETGVLDTVASYDYMSRLPPELPFDPVAAVGAVAVSAGQFVYTRSDKPEIAWRLPDGAVTQIVRWRAEPTLLTEELLEPVEAYDRTLNRNSYPHLPSSRIEEFTRETMSWYEAGIGQPLPLYGSPFADAEGRIWLPSYRLAYAREASPYTVVSSDGEWLGRVETPPRFRILDVAGELVLGVLRNEMDVENVVVYELTDPVRDGAELVPTRR